MDTQRCPAQSLSHIKDNVLKQFSQQNPDKIKSLFLEAPKTTIPGMVLIINVFMNPDKLTYLWVNLNAHAIPSASNDASYVLAAVLLDVNSQFYYAVFYADDACGLAAK